MHLETNKLVPADLDVKLDFPDGGRSEAGRLTITCRKSNLVVAEIDMTANDVVNLLARRSVGSPEGETRLLNSRGRACLNMERALVIVQLPFAVDVFDAEDGRNMYAWSADAMRAYGAQDFRISRSKVGYTLALVFFLLVKDPGVNTYLDVVHEKLQAMATAYGADAIQKRAAK